MAGSHIFWVPLLLSCVFQASDNQHVSSGKDESDVADILSGLQFLLPNDLKNINVTSINIKTCTGVKEQFTLLNKQLNEANVRNKQLDGEVLVLRRRINLNEVQLARCSSTSTAVSGCQSELQIKLNQLLDTYDTDTFLILKVLQLSSEINRLQHKIKLATVNSTETSTTGRLLQIELQDKLNEFNGKKRLIEGRNTNSALILEIISLQNLIWDLEKEESRTGESSQNTEILVKARQQVLDKKLQSLLSQSDATSYALQLVSVYSKIERAQRLINVYSKKSSTAVAEHQKQLQLTIELLRQKILQLKIHENDQELTQEILALQAKLEGLTLLIANTRNITETQMKEQRFVWELEKKQQELLLKRMEEIDYAQAQTIIKIINMMKEWRERQIEETTTSKETSQALIEKYVQSQAEIRELQKKLKAKTEECSGLWKEYTNVKTELDLKIVELKRSGESKTALILDVINLQNEISALKVLIVTDAGKVSELQKQLEEKQQQLRLKTAEIGKLIANPRIILTIIELQNQIHNFQRVATNETTSSRIQGLQIQIDDLINEIDSGERHISLILKILTLQNQVKSLQSQLSELDKLHISEVTILRNDLKVKIKELKKCTSELTETNQTRASLILKITYLQSQLRNIEEKWQNDNMTHVSTINELQVELSIRRLEHERDQNEIRKLQKELQTKTDTCFGLEQTYIKTKTELEQTIEELRRRGESKTSLVLNMINLHGEVKTLTHLIASTKEKDKISALQKQLNEKQEELKTITAELERLVANPRGVLVIIQLQNEIWELQRKDMDNTTRSQVEDLQNRVDDLIGAIDTKRDENVQLVLQIVSLQSHVKQLQGLLFNIQAKTKTEVTQLTNDLTSTKKLLQKYINELMKKDQTNANLVLRITDLTNQLRHLEVENQEKSNGTSAAIIKLKEELKRKEQEHFQYQATIKALQDKLNQTESQCSTLEQQLQELQTELDRKVKELVSKSNSVSSLVVQISTLNLQLEESKRQLDTESHTKLKGLQKIIEEKTRELAEKTEELKKRSPQAQRFLHIITIQNEIEKYVNVAANETNYDHIKVLEDRLSQLIEGIQDEENENTKLTFKVLSHQDEIIRLKKLEEAQTKAYSKNIADLQKNLEDIRNEINEKTDLLNKGDKRIQELTSQIMNLHKKIQPLEEEIADLKETNADTLKDLQKRLNLKEKQLQDSEVQLNEADAKNFEYIKEITDLRAQLKKTQKTKDKMKDLEEKVQAQQAQITKLESANRDLKRDINALTGSCHNDCEDVKIKLQQTLDEVSHLQQQLTRKKTEVEQLQQRLEEETGLTTRLQQQLKDLEKRHEKSRALQDQLERQLSEKEAVIKQQQRELEQRTTELSKLQGNYNRLETENSRLEKSVQELQNNLTDKEETTIHPRRMTFDPSTAHPRILLSAGNTKMSTVEEMQNVPDNLGRFDVDLAALGSTGFSGGRQYWEVSVAGKLCYHVGMASKSSPRKGTISYGPRNGYWTLVLNKQGQLRAIDNRPSVIQGHAQPLRLGILLDYKKGQISFYDPGTRSHIYSFVGQKFTDEIYPFVNFCVEEVESMNSITLLTPGPVDWIK